MSLRFRVDILSASGVFVFISRNLSTSGVFAFYSGHIVGVWCLCVLEWTSCRRRVSLCFSVDILSPSGVLFR